MIGWLRKYREGVGLDLGREAIKVVQLRNEKGRCTLTAWGRAPVPPGAVDRGLVKNRDAVADVIRGLFEAKDIASRKVIVALSASSCFVRHLVLPSLSRREVKRAARLQVESQLPWTKEEAVVDVAVYEESRDSREVEVLVAAARKTAALEIEKTLKEAGLIPVAAEIAPLACYRLLNPKCDDAGILLVDLGAGGIQFAYFAGGRLKMLRNVVLSPVDYDSLPVLANTAEEIRKTLEYAQVQQVAVEPTRVVITGGGAEKEGVKKELRSLLPYWQVSDVFDLADLAVVSEGADLLGPSYAAALGMALRGIRGN